MLVISKHCSTTIRIFVYLLHGWTNIVCGPNYKFHCINMSHVMFKDKRRNKLAEVTIEGEGSEIAEMSLQ